MPSSSHEAPFRPAAHLAAAPRDTSSPALNALRHGVLSRQALLSGGPAAEDTGTFDQLSSSLRSQAAPVGPIEDLLVETLVMLVWRWRRLLSFESATVESRTQRQLELSEREWLRNGAPGDAAAAGPDTRHSWLCARADLDALQHPDPLAHHPELWRRVFSVARQTCGVSGRRLFALKERFASAGGSSRQDVEQVIADACKRANLTPDQFWNAVRAAAQQALDDGAGALARRDALLAQQRRLASLAADREIQLIQRYEAHLSRQFYRALHELQRLQALRQGLPPAAMPIAIDISTP